MYSSFYFTKWLGVCTGFVPFFSRNKFQAGLLQDSDWFFQISIWALSFQRFQNHFSFQSYISYNVNSENFIAHVGQIYRIFLSFSRTERQNKIPGLCRFPRPIQTLYIVFWVLLLSPAMENDYSITGHLSLPLFPAFHKVPLSFFCYLIVLMVGGMHCESFFPRSQQNVPARARTQPFNPEFGALTLDISFP